MINEEKLRAAKEKLACHIQPPGISADNTTYTADNANAGAAAGGHLADEKTDSRAEAGEAMPCAASEEPGFIDKDGRVLLTRMTTAGG